jgi:hypothetical protein
MTDLLLGPTGNATQYEVIADGQIVGRIALSALSEAIVGPGYGRSILPSMKGTILRTASRRRPRRPCRRSLEAGSIERLS